MEAKPGDGMQHHRAMWFAFLLLLVPGRALTGNLHRCVDGDGAVSYQGAACSDGQRTDRIIRYEPDPPAVIQSMAPSIRGGGGRNAVVPRVQARLRGSRTGTTRPTRSEACRRAKASRTQQLDRLGLKRTFDDLGRIDAAVRAVCNGY